MRQPWESDPDAWKGEDPRVQLSPEFKEAIQGIQDAMARFRESARECAATIERFNKECEEAFKVLRDVLEIQ